MNIQKVRVLIGVMFISLVLVRAIKFERYVVAVGFPYTKILMSLGTCKERVLFDEQKVWANVKMNRIFDIYYSSAHDSSKVSKVEINVVLNNTDCFALSEKGVGFKDFSATVFVPTRVAIMFYRLTIFTCKHFKP